MTVETAELTLTGMAYGGDAIGRDAQGRMLFVPFAAAGERVRVEIVDAHARWARARLVEVLEPSPARAAPRCRHFTVCGGCHYQHLDPAEQLRAKAEIVAEQLRRIGGFERLPAIETMASPSPWGTRNHAQFHLTSDGRPGYLESGSSRVVAIEECPVLEPALADLWPRLDLAPVPGLDRVTLRAGADGQVQIVFEAEVEPEVELQLDLPASAVWLDPSGATVLAGTPWLVFEVLGQPFRVSAGAFFQVHSGLVGPLVERAMQALAPAPGEVAFDLYAGVGLFSLFLAQAGAQVIAVEASPAACADFAVNLDACEGVSLYEAEVEQALPAIPERPDLALVDPPRAGLGRHAAEALIARGPRRLAYVSCDPATLARDGRRLAEAGYTLEALALFDLFPQTYHIETLSLWVR